MSAENPSSGPEMELPRSCEDKVQHVQWADLPLCCPMPGTTLWNGHPRIYLPVHRDGTAKCTYCGTVYVLDDPPADAREPEFSNMEIEKDYRRAHEASVARERGEG